MSDATARAWKQVRTTRASEDVVAQIKHAFFSGMKSGDWVGTEADLAERFGTSRVTIRDAVRSLEVQGIVEVKVGAGGGLRIADADPDRFADALSVQLHLQGITWHEVLEAMQAVEPLTARLAAERATPEDIERLRASIAASTAAWADEALFAEAALDFHLLVAEAARSRALRSSVRALRSMQSLKFEVYAAPPRDKRVTHSHEKILAAIEAGDGELAEASMRAHLHTMAENPIYDEAEAKAEIG